MDCFSSRLNGCLKATTISKYENIPFEKAFGTIVSERVADAVMLLGIIGLAFVFQTELLSSYLFPEDSGGSGYTYYILGVLGILGVIFIWMIRKSKPGRGPSETRCTKTDHHGREDDPHLHLGHGRVRNGIPDRCWNGQEPRRLRRGGVDGGRNRRGDLRGQRISVSPHPVGG